MIDNIREMSVIDTLETNYMPYSMSVIVSRALPEIDGLKPSHRKLLYTMYKMGLLKGGKTKSANIVGQTMRLNPHGDMAIYQTMVRLTRGNEALMHPYIDSKGNFGKTYSRDMAFAAARYTEAKLDSLCEEFFRDIGKNTVEFMPNYDNTMDEPTLLPTTFPNILVNPNLGIAVGMASSICSFNLKEICEATTELIKDENIDLIDYLKAPDFSTGGELIYKEKDMRKIYEEGRGTFYLRGKYVHDKKNNCIDIVEIPYTTNVETIIDQIADLIKNGKIKEITDLRDETDKKGLKITLDVKRSTDVEKLMLKIFKFTKLQDSFSCNFNVLIDGYPKVLGVRNILLEWIKFRTDCIKKSIVYDIDMKSERLHLLRGLEKILLDIDKAVRIVRETKKDKEVIPNIMDGFKVDEAQAEFIAEIKLRNFNQEYILNKTKDIEKFEKELKNLEVTLNSDKKIKRIIINNLSQVSKKYGKERRTRIIHENHIEGVKAEDLIEDYNLKLFRTRDGYLKKISHASLRGNRDQRLKDGDEIVQEIDTTNKCELLLFTNRHRVYKKKVYEIEDCKSSSLGDYLQNLLGLEGEEKVIYMVTTIDYDGYMLFFFKNGKGTKIPIESYKTKTKRTQLVNAYPDYCELVRMLEVKEDVELVAISTRHKVLIFNTKEIEVKTNRKSQGVEVIAPYRGSTLSEIKTLEEVNYISLDHYRDNISSVGTTLRKKDKEEI
ncbi:MAG: DNA topoisomerase (ATP-hydrolyzing) subunit A [Anaeromicrobium sp.]|jgi:DNA gyrase subunit A|uniref:DNA gyrase/topoisomerase IV subunit A n=1 Tax=Anaeromicrobium sp. TaxID=1929132 RepID=UPI0025D82777|nr:DNA topoisomerase (ATP-hydrolyzing) subunit A [Anaeromicrobium sp.]MCT4592800.1 DNA topoisomerase (ATP-hydrolyzing) subunit A [Anaeromicrobium sp.]